MRNNKLYLFFILLFTVVSTAYGKEIPLCENNKVILVKKNILKENTDLFLFSESEKRFFCGDKSIEEWKEVPIKQARFHIKHLLKNKGYHLAEIKERNNKLYIDLKEIVNIKKVVLKTESNIIFPENKTFYRKPLTPDSLNKIDSWVLNHLHNKGYACAKIDVNTIPKKGIVQINIKEGKKSIIHNIIKRGFQNKNIMDRYRLFKVGDTYNKKLLKLSEQRALMDGVANSLIYSNFNCKNGFVDTEEKLIIGKSKIIKVGIGFDTEKLAVGKMSWRNTRWGENANSIGMSIYAHKFKQRFSGTVKQHPFSNNQKFKVKHNLNLTNIKEESLEAQNIDYNILFNYDNYYKNFIYSLDIGLNYSLTKTIDNHLVPTELKDFSYIFKTSFSSVDYHYNLNDPKNGFIIDNLIKISRKKLNSDLHASLVNLSGKYLTSLWNYDPANLVLGLRFDIFNARGEDVDILPYQFYKMLGGSKNIRGFSRNSLKLTDQGSLSTIYGGIELRTPNLFINNLDPFIFYDIGRIGEEFMNYTEDIYTSPGIGIRWKSPIGSIRGTYSHGYTSSKEGYNKQFFISFGEEF